MTAIDSGQAVNSLEVCSMMSFQIGDTVELKSGGPLMTISRLESEMGVLRAHCQWFDRNGTAQQYFYSVTSLKPVAHN
jgi:uncharacterized protein YodC (DUF2158 family)